MEAAALMVQKRQKYKKGVGNKNEERCTSCKKPGHSHETFYFIHGLPEGHPLHGKKFIRKDRDFKKNDKPNNYHAAATEETKGT